MKWTVLDFENDSPGATAFFRLFFRSFWASGSTTPFFFRQRVWEELYFRPTFFHRRCFSFSRSPLLRRIDLFAIVVLVLARS